MSITQLSSLSDLADALPDAEQRVNAHWLLVRQECNSFLTEDLTPARLAEALPDVFRVGVIDGAIAAQIGLVQEGCPAAMCVPKGLPLHGIGGGGAHTRIIVKPTADKHWQRACTRADVGFLNFHEARMTIFRAGSGERRQQQAQMEAYKPLAGNMEPVVRWFSSQLGETFETVVTPPGGEPITERHVIGHAGVLVVGHQSDIPDKYKEKDWGPTIESTHRSEDRRLRAVHRTFTPLGFHLAPIPDEVWLDASAYYYNNRHLRRAIREDWDPNMGMVRPARVELAIS
jgi:hypothetical protein